MEGHWLVVRELENFASTKLGIFGDFYSHGNAFFLFLLEAAVKIIVFHSFA